MKYKLLSIFSLMFSFGLLAQNNSQTFNGTNSYVDIGNDVLTGARTIEMWVKPSQNINPSISDFEIPLQRQTDNCSNCNEVGLIFDYNALSTAGKLRFKVHAANGIKYEVYSDTNSWAANTWYHIAGVIDSINGLSLYVDGVKQQDTNANWTIPVVASTHITAIGCKGDDYIHNFGGKINEVRISDVARYSNNFIPACEYFNDLNTLGLYKLDTIINGIAIDASTYSRDGVANSLIHSIENSCDNGIVSSLFSIKEGELEVSVYPNPTESMLFFDRKYSTIEVYNQYGGLILEQNLSNAINLENLSNGIYIVKIIDNKGKVALKKISKI